MMMGMRQLLSFMLFSSGRYSLYPEITSYHKNPCQK